MNVIRCLAIILALSLTASASAVEKVQYFISTMATGTKVVVSTVRAGQEFDLGVFVRDLRPAGTWTNDAGVSKPLIRGVFAGYCDVRYDTSICKEMNVAFNDTYPNGKEYHGSPGVGIDDTGAFAASFNGLGSAPTELFRVHMKAKEPGKVTFRLGFDVQHPKNDTLVYGNIGANPPEQSYVDLATELRVNNATLTINP